MDTDATSYYRRTTADSDAADTTAARFESTIHAQGTWQEIEQHMGAASGLLTHELLRHQPRADMRLGRISFEILGMIPTGEFTVDVETIRPGRTIELLEARMSAQGRVCIVARAWRLKITDTTSAEHYSDDPLPGPHQGQPFEAMKKWPGGFIQSLQYRVLDGHAPGKGRCWITTPYATVEGEQRHDTATLVGMVDTVNGVAPVIDPASSGFSFPNVELQIHLYREPRGTWLGLRSTANAGPDGFGLTSAILYDEHGPFGRSQQLQTLRPMHRQSSPTG